MKDPVSKDMEDFRGEQYLSLIVGRVYMYMHVYEHLHMHIHLCTHKYANTHMNTYTHMHIAM